MHSAPPLTIIPPLEEFSSPLAVVQVGEVTLLQPHVGVILQAGGEVGGELKGRKGNRRAGGDRLGEQEDAN